MKKEKMSDGFPMENTDWNNLEHYPCDNCGKEYNYHSNGVKAFGGLENGPIHSYGFCSESCAKEFAEDNGFAMLDDDSNECDYEFVLEEVQAEPVNENPETSEPEGEIDPEDVGNNGEEPDIGDNSEDPKLVDEKEASNVPKKKITECWAEVVERAREIAEIAQKIVETNETLKYYKKEYDSLVKKQNDYILTNGSGIQLTFEDCDPAPVAKDETPEKLPEEVDPDAWKKHSVRVLQGFTAKQLEKIEANFSTLGAVQEWACKDFREKMPGIGQALQDKLIDAMSDYATYWFNQCQERSNSDNAEGDSKDETPEKLPEEVDPDAWKKHSVRVLQGFTAKQLEKIEANFSTLGAVQEWACKDFREKMPGIGQALQDKLIDAMSDYATYWFNQCQERSNSDNAEGDSKDETPEEESNEEESND